MDWSRKNKKGEIPIPSIDIFLLSISIIILFGVNIFTAASIFYLKGRNRGYKAGYQECKNNDNELIKELYKMIDNLLKEMNSFNSEENDKKSRKE